jgi:simple sugar transport system permease protein
MDQPRWLGAAVSLGAMIFALFLGGVILSMAGGNPIRSYSFMLKAAFGSWGVFSDTLVKATPACAVAFSMRLWNIGAEGQFYIGAFGASAVVLAPLIPLDSPAWLMILTMVAVGTLAGAAWGFVPGFLKARYNVNEIISSLMMNYIAVAWNNFFIFAVWSEGGFQMSPKFPKTAWLPRLTDYAEKIPAFRGLTAHLGLVFGVVMAGIIWWVLLI